MKDNLAFSSYPSPLNIYIYIKLTEMAHALVLIKNKKKNT